MTHYRNTLLWILCICSSVCLADTLTTQYGRVSGIDKDGCTEYLGIPYAAPPMGELAFRHPVPPTPWDTVLRADHGRANWIQHDSPYSMAIQSRDALYMNIYVPQSISSTPLPVMVWIHGGGFTTGGAGIMPDGEMHFDMALFAQETQTIVVTFNYRLNVEGFLYLSYLNPQFEDNCGLYDQLMALRFVKKNIAAFGGDTTRITLFGQSAGAASILAIMTIPEADDLYTGCIAMSPCAEHFLTKEEAQHRTSVYLRGLGLSANHADQLLTIPTKRIQKRNYKFQADLVLSQGDLRCAFSPVIDGTLLKEAPWKAVCRSHKPLIIGYVANEARLFMVNVPKSLTPMMSHLLHVDMPSKKELDLPYDWCLERVLSEQMFFRPIDSIYAHYTGPKWCYEYTYQTPQIRALGGGCAHSYDMHVLFGWHSSICDPNDEATMLKGKEMRAAYKHFAYTQHADWIGKRTF